MYLLTIPYIAGYVCFAVKEIAVHLLQKCNDLRPVH